MANSNLLFPLTEDGSKLSEQMAVQPLMRDQVARYKLIESDEDDPFRMDQEGKVHLKKTPGYTMVGKKRIFDPIAKRTVTIMNKSTTRQFKTPWGEVVTTKPEPVKFMSDRPVVEVREEDPEKYAFLERADENIDNPFRKKKVKPRYYRIDSRKKLAKELEKDGFEVSATQWVWKEASYIDLKACAVYVNAQRPDAQIKVEYKDEEASVGYEMIKRALFAIAKVDPHVVIKGSSMIGEQMRMQVMDAEKLQIILFVDGKKGMASKANTWFHNDAGLTTICTIEPGKNKHEELLDFLVKDPTGKKHYTKIIETLKKFLNPNE